ncbi:MAG: hypothetical protein J6D31_10115 [Clostridia bacterium]|nr:hypothetical protein [Clostridia bacterium]
MTKKQITGGHMATGDPARVLPWQVIWRGVPHTARYRTHSSIEFAVRR